MRVVVSSHGEGVSRQNRTYAEYRVFSALSTCDDVVGARVQLRTAGDEVQCIVHVALNRRGAIDARASAPHAAAAIDRATERVVALIDAPPSALST